MLQGKPKGFSFKIVFPFTKQVSMIQSKKACTFLKTQGMDGGG